MLIGEILRDGLIVLGAVGIASRIMRLLPARYDDTLNNTTDERREINAAIGLGAAADFLHAQPASETEGRNLV